MPINVMLIKKYVGQQGVSFLKENPMEVINVNKFLQVPFFAAKSALAGRHATII